jgi:hypothetical protein
MRETGVQGKRDVSEVKPTCRASFYDAWGVTPDEQISLEQYYDSMSIDGGIGDTYVDRMHPLDQM